LGGPPSSRVVLLGAPGSGKGTVGRSLAAEMGVPLVSTGDMLRRAAEEHTALGQNVRKHLRNGSLVPDDVMHEVVSSRLSQDDCNLGFVLDGFPRTLRQAEALEGLLSRWGAPLGTVLYIVVDKDTALRRSQGRLSCSTCGAVYHRLDIPPRREGSCDVCGSMLKTRVDDSPETVATRWEHFSRQTEPLVAYFASKRLLYQIEGDRPPGEVLEAARARVRGDGEHDDTPQDL
jgi:adenylate kinase